jgi:lipid A 3-O-deacylase
MGGHGTLPEPERETERGGAFSIYFENDLFSGTDRYYTNGARAAWSTGDLDRFDESPAARQFGPLLRQVEIINRPKFRRNFAITLGQEMFTPDNTETRNLVLNDRPYAGWLYVGLGLIWKNETTRNAALIQLGVVGPWSLAEETQRFIHRVRGLALPQGWDNQIQNELGAVLAFEHKRRYRLGEYGRGFAADVQPYVGFAAGNVLIYANVGAEFRFGYNLPDDFGTDLISPAGSTSTPLARGGGRSRLGVHAFARADGRAVARNIFLDGNTFEDSHSISKRWAVGQVSAGLSINYRNTKLTYAAVFRTREFYGQREPQAFGAVTLTIAY